MEVNPPGPTSINRSVRHINIIIIVTVDSRSVWRNSYFARRLRCHSYFARLSDPGQVDAGSDARPRLSTPTLTAAMRWYDAFNTRYSVIVGSSLTTPSREAESDTDPEMPEQLLIDLFDTGTVTVTQSEGFCTRTVSSVAETEEGLFTVQD